MSKFNCRIVTDSGKIINDVYEADTKAELLYSFGLRKYKPISIDPIKSESKEINLGSKKLKLKSLILFSRQTATLLKSGVPLLQCFDIIASQTDDKKMKQVLTDMSVDMQSGAVFSAAVGNRGDIFPPMMSKMIKVGEESGDLPGIMNRLATQYESDNHIRQRVKGAATYPAVLIVVALIATIFMLVSIVPRFVDVFSSLDSELPVLTQILLALSNFITQKWYVLVIAIPLCILGIKRLLAKDKVRYFIDEKKLSLKLIKGPMQKIFAASFARTLYTLIASGVPVAQALEYARSNINNVYASQCMESVIENIKNGEGIAAQMALQPVFPKLLVSMISIGEQSGNLEEMLDKTAGYYDEEMDAAIGQLMSIMEPMMIVIVGILIGGIVMALYAPMFGMITAMQSGI